MTYKFLSQGLFIAFIAATITSCVPAKKVSEITDNYEKCEENRSYLATENARLEKSNTENASNLKRAEEKFTTLKKDTARTGAQFRQLQYQYDKLLKTNAALVAKQEVLSSGSRRENKELMAQLLETQEVLQVKEDSLKLLAYDLNIQKSELSQLNSDLHAREARVKELEDLLAQKDAAVNRLKNQIKEALIGFEDKGITVEQKNGRVYVSMEAQLLFGSGSTSVGAEGKTAIVQLGKALEGQQDLTVLVEGHTDSDKLKGTGKYKDNWELSSERAISVVRIMLLSSDLDPAILTAAGRGEFSPIAKNDSPEHKAINRRIEVILTPNLDKLFEILEEGKTVAAPSE
ncbi:MAG: chemotaxis protein MotB [Salibacteraceae bacterium]|jgi:chemotaxis protein MotB